MLLCWLYFNWKQRWAFWSQSQQFSPSQVLRFHPRNAQKLLYQTQKTPCDTRPIVLINLQWQLFGAGSLKIFDHKIKLKLSLFVIGHKGYSERFSFLDFARGLWHTPMTAKSMKTYTISKSSQICVQSGTLYILNHTAFSKDIRRREPATADKCCVHHICLLTHSITYCSFSTNMILQ